MSATFTKEQLEELTMLPDSRDGIVQLTWKLPIQTFRASDLAAFALAQMEGKETAEAERDRLELEAEEADDAINDAHALLQASGAIPSMFNRWKKQAAVLRVRERAK